jgi:hypothetical protein
MLGDVGARRGSESWAERGRAVGTGRGDYEYNRLITSDRGLPPFAYCKKKPPKTSGGKKKEIHLS